MWHILSHTSVYQYWCKYSNCIYTLYTSDSSTDEPDLGYLKTVAATVIIQTPNERDFDVRLASHGICWEGSRLMPCSTNHLLWNNFRSLLVAEVYLPSLALCKSVPSNDFKHLACKTMAPHQKTSKPPLLDPRWLVSFNLPVVASINSRCRPAVRRSTSFWLERLELESGCILRHPHSPIHGLPKLKSQIQDQNWNLIKSQKGSQQISGDYIFQTLSSVK